MTRSRVEAGPLDRWTAGPIHEIVNGGLKAARWGAWRLKGEVEGEG
jgi:hypothetical protein